jgi:hypothetical protein
MMILAGYGLWNCYVEVNSSGDTGRRALLGGKAVLLSFDGTPKAIIRLTEIPPTGNNRSCNGLEAISYCSMLAALRDTEASGATRMRQRAWRRHYFTLIALIALIAIVVSVLHREDPQRNLMECKSNLKNLGTAMEMYSTDWSGHYPDRFEKLVPNYLETLPSCPAVGAVTYEMERGPEAPHNEAGFQDYYYLFCAGNNHARAGVPENGPGYDCCMSILER